MGKTTSSTTNMTLTNYAKGIAQDNINPVAERIAPVVAVGVASGQYRDFNAKNAFQLVDTERAIGGNANRIELDATAPYFNCKPHALEIAIDDYEVALEGDDATAMREEKVRTLVAQFSLARLNRVKGLVTAVTAVSGKGVWADNSGDPVAEMNEQIVAISKATGMMPNLVVIDPTSLLIAANNTKTIARQPGSVMVGALSVAWLQAALIGNPQVLINGAAQDSTKRGVDQSNDFTMANTVVILHSSVTPTKYDPSAFKTFRSTRSGVEGVREYRDERARSQILALDTTEDMKTVSSVCVKKITVS